MIFPMRFNRSRRECHACVWGRLVAAAAQCRQDRKKRAITAPANTHRVTVIISNSMRPKRRPLRSSPAERSVIALSSGPAKALQSFSPVKGKKVRGRLAPGQTVDWSASMTRGRCGSLILHRTRFALSTPCRSPGASRIQSGMPLLSGPQ